MNQHPGKALSDLQQMDASLFSNKKEKAYYYLLLSAALDKNYIDIENDSLISVATGYYSKHGTSYNRMRSRYYQGIVRMNAKRYNSAIISFEEARQDAVKLKDYRYLGLIHRNINKVFNATNNFIEARKHIHKAISYFNKNRDTSYALYATYSLAVNFINNAEGYLKTNDLDSCLYYLNMVRSNNNDETLRASADILYAQALVLKGDSLKTAINLFRTAPKTLFSYHAYSYYALAFAKTGQLDSANKWMSAGLRSARSQTEMAALNSFLFRIDSLEGRYQEALHKVTGAMAVQDSLTRVLLQQSLSIAQKDFYQQESAIQKTQVQKQRLVIIFISILFLFALFIILLVSQSRKRKQNEALKEQMALFALTKLEARKESGALVGALFIEKMANLCGLSSQYFSARDDEEKKSFFIEFKRGIRELTTTPELFKDLEKDLNKYCSGIMDKLKEQVPGIQGTNRKIISLFFAGIPDTYVQAIMKRASVGSLRTLRSRFRQTIKETNAPDINLFLNMLDTEKQPGKKTKE